MPLLNRPCLINSSLLRPSRVFQALLSQTEGQLQLSTKAKGMPKPTGFIIRSPVSDQSLVASLRKPRSFLDTVRTLRCRYGSCENGTSISQTQSPGGKTKKAERVVDGRIVS